MSLFFLLGFLFIPFTFFEADYQQRFISILFLKPVVFIQDHLFTGAIHNVDFSSDTIGLNILLTLLLILAFIIVLILNLLKIKTDKLPIIFRNISAFYIAAVLLKYGFDKVFKYQFYLPEPNILYAPFGSLHKDILFWSTIGLSHTYSVITGSVEVLTAILILIKRTRVLGFCVAIFVLANVLLINFSFDISVKTFTLFLLAVVLFNLYPYIRSMYAFFIRRKTVQLSDEDQPKITPSKWLSLALSIVIIGFIIYPYIATANFNDDNAPRPYLHGAYQVEHFSIGSDTLKPVDFPYKRLFIHRNNYIIFQHQDDEMTDFFFEADYANHRLTLIDYDENKVNTTYNCNPTTGELQLKINNKTGWTITARALNWKALPALQNELHYTIDEVK